jgi:hypothetical protein
MEPLIIPGYFLKKITRPCSSTGWRLVSPNSERKEYFRSLSIFNFTFFRDQFDRITRCAPVVARQSPRRWGRFVHWPAGSARHSSDVAIPIPGSTSQRPIVHRSIKIRRPPRPHTPSRPHPQRRQPRARFASSPSSSLLFRSLVSTPR